ncbi:hypothetical protein INR49_016326 [Caranx melampygus]|nr:hypothetical protein INR49_016326 [Caranx melampygus]
MLLNHGTIISTRLETASLTLWWSAVAAKTTEEKAEPPGFRSRLSWVLLSRGHRSYSPSEACSVSPQTGDRVRTERGSTDTREERGSENKVEPAMEMS